jgi:hypothetical protein
LKNEINSLEKWCYNPKKHPGMPANGWILNGYVEPAVRKPVGTIFFT